MQLRFRLLVCLVLAAFPQLLSAQWVSSGSSATTPIYYSGPVGVGTAGAPGAGYNLDVAGVTRLGGNVFLGTNAIGPVKLYLWPDTSGPWLFGYGTGIDFRAQGGQFRFTNGDLSLTGYGATALTVKGTVTGGAAANFVNSGDASLLYIRNDGFIGIGTTAPAKKLHVAGGAFVSDLSVGTSITNFNNNILDASGIGLGSSSLAWSANGMGYVAAVQNQDATAGSRNGLLTKIAATDAGARALTVDSGGITRFVVRGDGRIGVGTTNPSTTFEVVGDANFTGSVTGGNIKAHYQDVAEWVPAAEKLLPGAVVVLSRDQDNEVRASRQAYDTAVAGVVSAKPGIILGEESDTKAQVATTGRVRVRVDATRHPIAIGDLLVTSDKPGMAMYSEPVSINGRRFHQPGTIIGKALQSLADGEGEILVLLSLQ